MGHRDGHPCPHGVYPYAMCEYCDELYLRAQSYLVEQKYVIFGALKDLSDPIQLDDAAEWVADLIAAVVPDACMGSSMGQQHPHDSREP